MEPFHGNFSFQGRIKNVYLNEANSVLSAAGVCSPFMCIA